MPLTSLNPQKIGKYIAGINRTTALHLSEQAEKLSSCFLLWKNHQYFQVSVKFHTISHSFAFSKASHFPDGAAVAPPVSLPAWG